MFVKRFAYQEGKTYPDFGVNFETFTNQDMLEIETLGPLIELGPGKLVEHVEHWELFSGLGRATDEDALGERIIPRLSQVID